MFGLIQRVGIVLGVGVLGTGVAISSLIPPPVPANSGSQAQEGWSLRFEKTEHGFGEITDERPIEMRFPFTNTGMETITIKRMHSYCGCTTPALEKKVYEPGESGEIRVVFDPSGRHGGQVKRIMVYTDDSVQPIKTMIARGYVRPIAYLEPNVVNFGEVEKDAEISKVMYVLGEKADFEVTEIKSSNPDLLGAEIVGSAPVDQNGVTMQRWTVRVDLLGAKRSGRYAEELELVTNDPRRPSLNQTVMVRVPSELRLGWAMVRVGGLSVGDELEEEIVLGHERGIPFKITSIESESVNLDLSFEWTEPESPEDPHTITVRGSAIKGGGAIQDRIVITTDLEDEEPMTVAFRGRVIDPSGAKKAAVAAPAPSTEGVVEIED